MYFVCEKSVNNNVDFWILGLSMIQFLKENSSVSDRLVEPSVLLWSSRNEKKTYFQIFQTHVSEQM